jgi:chromosome segregation ATPase
MKNFEQNSDLLGRIRVKTSKTHTLYKHYFQDARLSSLESNSAVLDNKLNSLESADAFLQESHRLLIEKTTHVETELKHHSGTGSSMTERLESLTQNVKALDDENNEIKSVLGHIKLQIHDTETRTSSLEAEGQASKELTERISQAVQSINQQIAFMESTSSTTWESVEAKLNGHHKDLARLSAEFSEQKNLWGNVDMEIDQLKGMNGQFIACIDLQKNEIDQLQEHQKGHERGFEEIHEFRARIHSDFSDIQAKMGNFSAKLEDIDKDQTETKSCMEKQDQKIGKLAGEFQLLDSKQGEALEKIQEVRFIASNLDFNIKSLEEKTEKRINFDFENFSQKLALLETIQGAIHIKIDDLDLKGQGSFKVLQAEAQGLGSKVSSLNEISQGLAEKISHMETSQVKKFHILDDLILSHGDKIQTLEEASMRHFEHAQYVDSLNQKVLQLDEARQQSEAKAKDEVDGTFDKYQCQLSEARTDLENRISMIENHLKESNEHANETTGDLQRHMENLENKNKMNDQAIAHLQNDVLTSTEMIATMRTDIQQKINEFNDRTNEMNKKIGDIEKDNNVNIERLITIQETSRIEKVSSIEALSEKVNKIDIERQETEQKLNDQNSALIAKNANAIQDLAKELEGKLGKIEQVRTEVFQNLSQQADSLKIQLNLLLIEQQRQVDELESVKEIEAAKVAGALVAVENTSKLLEQKLRDKAQEIEEELKKLDEKLIGDIKGVKEEQIEGINDLKDLLLDMVNKNKEHIKQKVEEAEHHVENLRELNGKLIDQVKEKMKFHEEEQTKISEDLKSSNYKQMETLKEGFNDQLQALINIKDEHTVSISSISSTMFAMKESLSRVSDNADSNTGRLQKLELSQETQDNKLEQLENLYSEISRSCKMLSDEADLMANSLNDSQVKFEEALKEEIRALVKDHKDSCTLITGKMQVSLSSQSEHIKEAFEKLMEQEHKIKDVEESLPEKMLQQKDMIESKFHEFQVTIKKQVDQMDESIKTNTSAIEKNASLVEFQTKHMESFHKADTELTEKFCGLHSAMDIIRSQIEVLERQEFDNMESIKAEYDTERKKIDDLKRHVSELDDAVTLMTPDIKNIVERLFHLEEKDHSNKLGDIVNQIGEIRDSVYITNNEVKEKYENLNGNYSRLLLNVDELKNHVENLHLSSNTQNIHVQEQIQVIKMCSENLEAKLQESVENAVQLKEEQAKLLNPIMEEIKSIGSKYDELQPKIVNLEKSFPILMDRTEDFKVLLEDTVKSIDSVAKADKDCLLSELSDLSQKMSVMENDLGQNREQLNRSIHMYEQISNFTKELQSKVQENMTSSTSVMQENIENVKRDLEDMKQKKVEGDGQLLKVVEKVKCELEDVQTMSQTLVESVNLAQVESKNLRDKLNKAEDDANFKIKSLEEMMKVYEEKISMVEEKSMNTLEKLVSLEEATLNHAEKAQYIEVLSARVSQVDEMRQQNAAEAKDEINSIISENQEKIKELHNILQEEVNANQSLFRDLKNEILLGKQNMEDMRAEKQNFQDALAKYQEMMELKLQEVDCVAKINESSLKSLQADVRNISIEVQADLEKTILASTNMIGELKSDMTNLADSTIEAVKRNQAEVQSLKDMCSQNQEEIRTNNKEHCGAVTDLKNANLDSIAAIRNDYDTKLQGIMESMGKQTTSIEFATTFVNSSQEIFNTLTMSNAQQEEQLKALENQFQVLDNKLKNLESADLFLQEAHRILTEKTTHVESESKKIEENISSQLKDQQEEINTKIKVQVSSLLKDVSELTTDKLNILETLTLIKEKEHGYDEKIKRLEEANIESLKSSNSYVDGLLEGIHEQFKFNIEKIETKIDNNTTLIQENDVNIKSNNENILNLQKDLKLFSNNLDELRSFDVISNIQVLQADRNELKVQIDTVHNDIKTVTDKMNTEFEGLAPQVQKNKENFNELQKTTETIFMQLSSHFTNIEKLSDDNSSIIDELHNAEEKFTELDGQIVDLKKKLEDIEIKTGETVCKIAEITSLTNNIEVNVKSQELKLEQQKAVDMEVIASQIANLTGQLFQIQAEVGEVAVDRKNFMEHLDVLQTQMNDDKTFYKAESETMRTKVDSYLSILNTLENEFNKLVRESKGNEDSNKVLAKRISDLELLDKKIVQLEEQQQMDRYQLTNHLDEKLMPVNAKLQKTQEDLDKRFETILTTDLANIKGFGELLKKEVEILRTETDARSKKIVELEQETKTLAFRVDTGVTDFNTKQESLADHVSAIATRLELLESDSGEHQQKLISLEEATFVQAEKARYVESLNERFSRMDEIRQQSESKSKEELEHTVASNAKAIEAIKQALGQRIQKLEEDIQGDFTSLKHDMESRIDNSNEFMKSNISGDIESRIIAIYSKIEEHRSLIEKTHTSVTFIREKVAQNESQQFGIQESLSKQNENNIEALRRDMHEKIQDLYSTTSEHSNVLSENNINIIQLNENNAVLSGRMAKNEHEINHLKVSKPYYFIYAVKTMH